MKKWPEGQERIAFEPPAPSPIEFPNISPDSNQIIQRSNVTMPQSVTLEMFKDLMTQTMSELEERITNQVTQNLLQVIPTQFVEQSNGRDLPKLASLKPSSPDRLEKQTPEIRNENKEEKGDDTGENKDSADQISDNQEEFDAKIRENNTDTHQNNNDTSENQSEDFNKKIDKRETIGVKITEKSKIKKLPVLKSTETVSIDIQQRPFINRLVISP